MPLQLIGLPSTINCNDGNFDVTLAQDTKVYLLYASGWSQNGMLGSKTGWSKVLQTTGLDFSYTSWPGPWFLYEKILTAGTHTLNNNSAYYFFDTSYSTAPSFEIKDVSSNQYNLEISKQFYSSTGFRSVYPSADTPTLPGQCDFTRYDSGESVNANLPTSLHGNSKTVTLQYRPQESSNNAYLITIGSADHQAFIRIYNGKIMFNIGDPGQWLVYIGTEITPVVNQWYDIAFTYGSNRNEIKGSVNGDYFDYNNANTSGTTNNTMSNIDDGMFSINSTRTPGNSAAKADYKNIKIFEGQATDITSVDPESQSIPAGCSSLIFDSAKGDGSDDDLELTATGSPSCPEEPMVGSSITHHGENGNNITIGGRGAFLGSEYVFDFDGDGDALVPDFVEGPNLITNSDFASDSDWTVLSNFTQTISNGELSLVRNGSNALGSVQAITTVVGAHYRVAYNLVSHSGNPRIYIGSSQGSFDVEILSLNLGEGIASFKATSTTTYIHPGVSGVTSGNITFSSISVYNISSLDGDFTISFWMNADTANISNGWAPRLFQTVLGRKLLA